MTLAGDELPGLRVDRIDPKVETERYVERIMATRGRDLDEQGRALLREDLRSPCTDLRVLGFAQNFLSSCELEALHFIGIGSFGEEFREDVVFRGIQEKFRKPLA